MVDESSGYEYHMTFEAVPPFSLLPTEESVLKSDLTNPRQLYSILSAARLQGTLLTSVTGGPQQTKLRTLQQSSPEFPRKQTHYSSDPDLLTISKPPVLTSLPQSARCASQHDVPSFSDVLRSKRLTPIQRGKDRKTVSETVVKNEDLCCDKNAETHLGKERPLPPIEDKCELAADKDTVSVQNVGKDREDLALAVGNSNEQHRRLSREIFPRGQPTEVRKPVTPTHGDYPEAYWELRSPTVQDPSDLKDDMIDRNSYRLQQISALHLRAMNPDLVVGKMDSTGRSGRGHLLPLGAAVQQDSSKTAGPTATSPHKVKKQVKVSLPVPVRNHTLTVAPRAASFRHSPSVKENSEHTETVKMECNGIGNITDEHHQLTSTDAGEKTAATREDTKAVKASVVNLYMTFDNRDEARTTVSYAGSRKNQLVSRPHSHKVKSHYFQTDSVYEEGAQDVQVQKLAAHRQGSISSSASPQRVLSASAQTPHDRLAQATHMADVTNAVLKTNAGSKLILKKFNRLQVFGEKTMSVAITESPCPQDLGHVDVAGKYGKPYLPQNRPPAYRLDMRNYPVCRQSANGRGTAGQDTSFDVEGGDYSVLMSERGGVPVFHHSSAELDATALSFCFRDGEVIVSRKGKKPNRS